MCTEKHVFVPKSLQMGLSLNGSPWSGNSLTLSSKENVLAVAISKEGNADSILYMKGSISIDFLEKDATVDCGSYCWLLRQYFTLFIE